MAVHLCRNLRGGPVPVLCLLFLSRALSAQQPQIDYNDVYRYNASIGVEYQSLSPFGDYGIEPTSYYDLSGIFRLPLPFFPRVQPFAQGGMIRFSTSESEQEWSHTHWYGLLGAGYTNRFSKNFEIGGDLGLGFSEAVFPTLNGGEAAGSPTLVISAGARIALNPSYGMSVDVHPNLKYFHSLTPLTRFNGLVLGIGFSGHYRFGQDPDAPQAVIRSVRFSDAQVPALFAAMQSYYAKNPFGRITLTNTEKYPLHEVDVSFFQPGFMDAPTKVAVIPEIAPGQSQTVELTASFNQEVFRTEGVTPLTADVSVNYLARGKPVKQAFPVSYDLQDKTALTWDDDRKVGAFITPADSALQNYTSFVRQSTKDLTLGAMSEPLQNGMAVFYALKEIGILYQVDRKSPFTAMQASRQVVDSINLPRDTLKRGTGDCDDLTVLYCALLETLGVQTAFITVPGHIYAAFNTKVPSRRYSSLHPDPRLTLNIDGELWVPVEITMIGTDDFLAAWRKGVEEYAALDNDPQQRGFYLTQQVQETYRPVGLRETDLGVQYGATQASLAAGFRGMRDRLVDLIIDDAAQAAAANENKAAYNRLGILCAQYERYPQAQVAFNRALTLDRNYVEPVINLGNLFFLQDGFTEAVRYYHQAEERLAAGGVASGPLYLKVLTNIFRTYQKIPNEDKAAEYYRKIEVLDATAARQLNFINASADGGGRSSRAEAAVPVLFAEEE